jgi:pyruvate-ferredoxin/flavodoxin oxidoreductase
MGDGMHHQADAVKSGYWPLFRYNPLKEQGARFSLDSKEPSIPVSDFMYEENRFSFIKNQFPESAKEFLAEEMLDVKSRWDRLGLLKGL